ncbi:DNA-binding transcriptional activator TdcA [Kluyvera cryocrescens]|uniref:DNA-binding transcriptional activator TdcA n=1 Tax=Kluyvera cryocrescens TaxID=580 RepID=A0A485AH65_KLUCR|nr:DNA-binding transcriptional activator TdcA [Kluyvera cryocrescens]
MDNVLLPKTQHLVVFQEVIRSGIFRLCGKTARFNPTGGQ